MSFYNSKILLSNRKYLDGNLQIIACAGSGKTEFVSERIAHQIQQKIAKPGEIVAFTFTEKAAEELKFRVRGKIKELIGKQVDIGDMYIGTIHAFAFRLLQDFIPRYRAYDMLDEVSRLAFLGSIRKDIDIDALKNSLLENFDKPFNRNHQNWVFSVFIRDVDIFREEGLTPEDCLSPSFKNAYQVYIDKLEEKRFLDFSAILRIAVDTLNSDQKVRKKIREQFKFFTVDEYQDVNPIQEELVQLVSGKRNVCVVGDDDQSIYQWRGADVKNILTFQRRYPDVAVYKLDVNRRSCDSIVKTGDLLINRNTKRLPKSIKDNGTKSENGDLYKIVFKKQEDEAQWIAEKIKSLTGTEFRDKDQLRKIKYSDIALEFRSIRNEASPYIAALKEAGIPVIYSGVGGLFDTPEISSIRKILEYICEMDRETAYDDNFLKEIHAGLDGIFSITFSQMKKGIHSIRDDAKGKKRLSLQTLYAQLLTLLGIADAGFHDTDDDVLLYNLGRFSQAISDYEDSREYLTFNSIRDFLWFIRLHAEGSYDSGNTDAMAGLIDAVQILTMHGTKGLGFPVVFLPCHLRKDRQPEFGPSFIDTEKVNVSRFLNHADDDRRLYYVALTRAKKFLFITSSEIKTGNTRRSPRTYMFDELPGEYCLTTPSPDPTKRKKCSIDGVSEEIRFPTSYSELAYFLSCGYDYKMRFIFGFNSGLVPALGFGKQVHNVINLLHKEYEDTKTIPSPGRIREVVEEHFYMRYASHDISERLKVSAVKSLQRYVQLWEQDFSLSVKTERPFEMEFDNALIAGSIDMIKRQNDDGSLLEVIDFKTGKPDNDFMHRYELQVQLYTIAAKEALGIETQKALIHFIDTEKDGRQAIDTSEAALDTAKEEIRYAVQGITKADFKRDARQNKICHQCDWKTICPKRKGFRE